MRVIENFLDGAEPVVQFVFVFRIFAAFLVFPVGCESLFCHLVHAVGTDLHFNPSSLLAHQGYVQGLIAVCLRMVEPVAQAVGVTLVYLADCHIHIEAFVYLVGAYLRRYDDADGEDVVDFFKRYVLVLHLVPNGIRALHTCLELVFYAQFVEHFAYWGCKLCEERVTLRLGISKLMLYVGIFLRMVVAEAEVLQFGLDLVETESVGERCINV